MASSQVPSDRPQPRDRGRFSRLRGVVAVLIVVFAVLVLGMYLRGRRDAARQVTAVKPLNWAIRQSAQGFTLSRSVAGRTLFSVYANRAVQMRQGNRDTLHNVRIELYGPDGQISDRIQGEQFDYDPGTSEVSAAGVVQIALRPRATAPAANPTASHPPEPDGAIEVQARDLAFNVKSGAGTIHDGLTFHYLDAQGSAQSASLEAHNDIVHLVGQVRLVWTSAGKPPVELSADSANLDRADDAVDLLGAVRIVTAGEQLRSDRLRLILEPDYSLRHLDADGHVQMRAVSPARSLNARADRAAADFAATPALSVLAGPARPDDPQLRFVRLDGAAEVDESAGGEGGGQLEAGLIDVYFGQGNQASRVQARDHAQLKISSSHGTGGTASGQRSITAPELDFTFAAASANADSRASSPDLQRVETGGRSHIVIDGASAALPSLGGQNGTRANPAAAPGSPLAVDSDRLVLLFQANNQPGDAEASGNVQIRQAMGTAATQARMAEANELDLKFNPHDGQVSSATLTGDVILRQPDGELRADVAVADPSADQVAFTAHPNSVFTGGVLDASTSRMRLRSPHLVVTGDSHFAADGGVQLALLSAGSGSADATGMFSGSGAPVQITSASAQLDQPAGGLAKGDFRGSVRLWQGENLLTADSVHLDQARRTLNAEGHVHTAFVQSGGTLPGTTTGGTNKANRPQPVSIEAEQASYDDGARKAVFQGGVILTTGEAKLSANRLEVSLAAEANPSGSTPATLRQAVATGAVTVTQPGRTAKSETATYDAAKGTVVMEGGPPSISDAEHGFLSGDRLTFSTLNDAMTVESQAGSRTVGRYEIGHN